MRWRLAGALAACVLLLGKTASAHRIDEYLQATILTVEPYRVQASMRLIPGVLVSSQIIVAIDRNGDGIFSEREQQAYVQRVLGDLTITIDGTTVEPTMASWSFPDLAQMREGIGEIRIQYTVDLPDTGSRRTLVLANRHLSARSVYLVNAVMPENRNIRVLGQKRNREQSLYELKFEQVEGARWGWRATWEVLRAELEEFELTSLFHLGMRHIAEGTDHLLFLLVLLLPAPLLASGTRWDGPTRVRQSLWRILGIVTAFTIGHSLTLSLAAFHLVHLPSRTVEVLIAVTILVSAVHALRPLFPGRETWIAAFFGLVHGLAFAATLDRLGFRLWQRMAEVLAFNLGIEAMQMLVVAMLLPSLMLMSRTKAYSALRVSGAVFAGAASLGWIAERLWDVKTPTGAIVTACARFAPWMAGGLFPVSLVCWLGSSNTHRRQLLRLKGQ